MIENALVFALGALTSALAALVLYPVLTRRSARLARRELEAELPRTLDEIAAMRDGIRAEYAARTAKVEAALATARQTLSDEKLAKASINVQLSALQTERRGYESNLEDAENRVSGAFHDLRDREETLARVQAEKRTLERQLQRANERLSEMDDRVEKAERQTNEMRMALAAAETSALAYSDAAAARGQAIDVSPLLGGHGSVPVVNRAQAKDAAPPTVDGVATDGVEKTSAPAAQPAASDDPPTRRGLPPEIAAGIAERLRAARMNAGARPADEGPAVSLPKAADFEVDLPAEPDSDEDADEDAVPGAITAAGKDDGSSLSERKFPKVARRFPQPGEDTFEPVVSPEGSGKTATPVPIVEPRDDDDEHGFGGAAEHHPLNADFVPRPVPVVTRKPIVEASAPEPEAVEKAEETAEAPKKVKHSPERRKKPRSSSSGRRKSDKQTAVETPADDASKAEQAPEPKAKPQITVETDGPEAPRTFAFPSMPAPAAAAASADGDLAPEERNRRVEDLAARLRNLRTRNAGTPAPSTSSGDDSETETAGSADAKRR